MRFLQFSESRKGSSDYKAFGSALQSWFAEASKAHWKSAFELKALYATASVVSSDRVLFNIKGNDYRLVTAIDFEKSIVWIKWLGTHTAYDRINVKEVRYNG